MKTASAGSSAHFESLCKKLDDRTARVGVIGLGYVGLPLVLLFSEQKFRVTGFDIDTEKVATLARGGSYIVRIPGTEIQAAQAAGFEPTTDYTRIADMDAVLIAVPTPLNQHHEPDLSFIVATAEAIAPHLRAGQLIILESTTYPGTTEELLVPILEKNPRGLKTARGESDGEPTFFVAFSPEREDPGNDSVARTDIPKVVGGVNKAATDLCCKLYGTIFRRTVPVSHPAVAEMTKLLENIYRCVNIALVNELKLLCLRMGINIWDVIQAAST
jgi:UDP-N-acetyl-D-glucosamine dehydrogenase